MATEEVTEAMEEVTEVMEEKDLADMEVMEAWEVTEKVGLDMADMVHTADMTDMARATADTEEDCTVDMDME